MRVDIARGKRLLDRLNGGPPPVLRILLGPGRVWRTECGMVRGRRARDAPVAGNEDGT